MAGQAQPLRHRLRSATAQADQESGQRQQPVAVGLPGRGRYRAPGARADIGEVVVRPGDRAAVEVEPESKLGEQPDLPPHVGLGPDVAAQQAEQRQQPIEQRRVRLVLRQGSLGQRAGGGQGRESQRIIEKGGGIALHHLQRQGAEMLGQARAPARRHQRAGLQRRPGPAGPPAHHHAGVPPVVPRQQGDDRRGLAMRPRRQHDALIGPFHASASSQ